MYPECVCTWDYTCNTCLKREETDRRQEIDNKCDIRSGCTLCWPDEPKNEPKVESPKGVGNMQGLVYNKIQLIKAVREKTGIGLKEAKDAVELVVEQLNVTADYAKLTDDDVLRYLRDKKAKSKRDLERYSEALNELERLRW